MPMEAVTSNPTLLNALQETSFFNATVGALIALALAVYFLSSVHRLKDSALSGSRDASRYPPIVKIDPNDMFTRPREAYESALEEHGPIVGVWRKGRLEYIVGPEFTKELLSDDRDFSFERGVTNILNFPSFIARSNFFKDVHMMVTGGIIPRMERTVEQIFPIFRRQAKRLVKEAESSGRAVDIFEHSHRCIAEAMLIVALGDHCASDQNVRLTEELAHAVATMTGIYQNTSPFGRSFPITWKVITWIRLVCGVILFKYYRVIVPIIWREVRARRYRPLDSSMPEETDGNKEEPLIHYIARMYADPQGRVSFIGVIWLSILILAFIFASVHQTASVAVWVMYELSIRSEYTRGIRDELSAVADSIDDAGGITLSYESLRRATALDSFVREVLRFKGDTLSLTRETLRDIRLGDFIIPKGYLVMPMTTLTHLNRDLYGENAAEFNAQRWAEGPPAAMVSLGYLPFGFGRWACPGRILAVTEIKMIVATILAIATPELEGGKYTVVDPLNVTSVPPVGRLLLHRLGK
ncbi:cytochrome P450 [Phlebopus sp. FC_14]|nr:cytochrome P450 [Phlebopus sp. FC_14]